MTKHLFTLFLYLGLIVTSCVTGWKVVYFFKFVNNSDKDIYVIIDTEPQDEVITVQSWVYYCYANEERRIVSNHSWSEVVKDSIHVYVIDASKIHLSTEYGVAQENIERITPDMVLAKKTMFHYNFSHSNVRVFYPFVDSYGSKE